MVQQHREGNEVKPWGMAGFDGFKCGSIQVGTRGHETIVRLTGGYAANTWRRYYALCDNVSRIDLQTTVDVGMKASVQVARHYKQAARARKKDGRFPKVWECRDSDGPATLYLGKRVSEKFARVYDKFAEAGAEWPESAVRYELQCNGQTASIVAAKLFKARSELLSITSHVWTYFHDRALCLAWSSAEVDNICCPRKSSDLERRLSWIQKAVRPSVQLLVNAGRQDEVLKALGLSVARSGKIHNIKLAKAG